MHARDLYEMLAGKPCLKRQIRRHIRTKVDNIKMNLKEIYCEDTGWIRVPQDRVQGISVQFSCQLKVSL
jgi:hypothetical protein